MKRKGIIVVVSLFLIAALGVGVYCFLTRTKHADEETVQELRKQYPAMKLGGGELMSMAAQPSLRQMVEDAECYAEIEYIEPAETLEFSEGEDKFGDSMGTYSLVGWRVRVKDVIFGDESIEGKEIVVRMNSQISAPLLSAEIPLITSVTTRDGGDYWLGSYGSFYCIDDVCMSVYEEAAGDSYSGINVAGLKKAIRKMK